MRFVSLFLILALFPPVDLWAMAKKPAAPVKALENQQLSLDLWDCYTMSLQRSETVAIFQEEISRTFASFLESSGEVIGDADFVMTESRQDPQKGTAGGDGTVGSTLQASERRERRFELSQPIFQGFKAVGAIYGSGSLRREKIGEWERAKQLLFMDVVNAFYDYLRYTKEVEIISGILNLFDDRIKDLKAWEDIGRSRSSEISTAQSRYQNFQAELARAKGDQAVAKNLLAFLIGVSVDAKELSDPAGDYKQEEPVDVLTLARERPDVKASRNAVQTARGALIVAQSELWPRLDLDSNLYEHREGFQSGTSWDTLVTFRVPLGKGGTTLAKVKDSWSEWKEAKLAHSLSERTAQREILDAYERWKSALERYKSLQHSVSSAQENFVFQQEDYKKRLVNNLDVLDALQNLFESRRDENEAFFDVKKNYWQLEVAKGHCCAETAVDGTAV